MESIGALNVFVKVAELGSFTAAGTVLGVSAPAVGKTIARMEERLGVRLFHRTTRSIVLTQEGASFLERCHKILSEIEAAEMELSQAHTTAKGRLRISLPLASNLMMPAVVAFMRLYPDIELELDFNDRMVDVISEGFDVVIRCGVDVDSRLRMREIGSFTHCIVGSPAYLARKGTPEKPQQLLKHACIHHKNASSGKLQVWPVGNSRAAHALQLPIMATATTLEAQIAIAEGGLGLTCVPEFSVRQQLKEGTLVQVLQSHMYDVGMFRLLWPVSRNPSPKVAAFVHFMADNLFKEHLLPQGMS